MSETAGTADAVDALIGQWRRERPDVDVAPMGVVGRISRVSRLLERGVREYFARHDLESWEFDVLATLRRSGEPYALPAGALLRAAMVTSGAITNRIDRLEAKGLVERAFDLDDRRSVRISLTPAGLAKVDEVLAGHVENESRLLGALSAQEQELIAGMMRKLLVSFGDVSLE